MVPQVEFPHLPDRFPLSCQWEITCRCNLRCVMCYTDCFNRPEFVQRELSTDQIVRIMDELAEAGTLELCLTGGEPMSRPDFFELYEFAVRKGFLVTVFTNGTLIHETEADRFANLPPHRIEISLHGSTTETFERVTRGRGSHERCLTAIRLLVERRLPVVLKATALTVNRSEILAIKDRVSSLGVSGFKLGEEIRPGLDGGGSPFQYALSEQELTILNRQDATLWEETCRRTRADLPPCRSGMQRFHIDAYGGLQLCSGNRRNTFDLRNGSFREGFFEILPTFACAHKTPTAPALLNPAVHHA